MTEKNREPKNHTTTSRWQPHRVQWAVAAGVALGFFLTSLPGYYIAIEQKILLKGVDFPPTTLSLFFNSVGRITSMISGVVSLGLSGVLFLRRFDDRMARYTSYYLLGYGIIFSGPMEALEFLWPGWGDLSVMIAQPILLTTPTVGLFCLFPNGKFKPRWSRWIVWVSIFMIPFIMILPPVSFVGNDSLIYWAAAVLWGLILLTSISLPVYRYLKVFSASERQQTKWVIFGLGLWVTMMMLLSIPYAWTLNNLEIAGQFWWVQASSALWWLTTSIIPITMSIGVMRYRLWDIDILINRTIVYSLLTTGVVGTYILVVGGLSVLFQTQGNLIVSLIATGLIAVLFHPLRERLQGWVNRIMYGKRDDPIAVLSQFGARLEQTIDTHAILPGIVETIAETLKLPYAAIEINRQGYAQLASSYGKKNGETQSFPLIHQAETIGQLVVAPRAPGEGFSPTEVALLENIAQRAGSAVHTVQLSQDLQQSRQRLVTTREEERRRLRRDLHDGLGPTLASITLKLDTIRNLIQEEPEKADQLLAEAKGQVQETIKDIRRLVYDLRPPALDELGFIPAVSQFIEQQRSPGLKVTLEAPDSMPQLPAAVEVAGYRIVQEGLTNVLRHAQASEARVVFEHQNSHLSITISDNGVGLPEGYTTGIGLNSMRERVNELGGIFKIHSSGKGAEIRATIPWAQE